MIAREGIPFTLIGVVLTVVVFLLAAVMVFMAGFVFAAGTVTQDLTRNNRTHVHKLVFSWTGDTSNGTVPATASSVPIDGYVFMVTTNPGSPSPTDGYDITLTDSDGVDIMGGELLARDETDSEQAVPKVDAVYGARYVSGTVTLTISSNSVHGAKGTVNVFFYDE